MHIRPKTMFPTFGSQHGGSSKKAPYKSAVSIPQDRLDIKQKRTEPKFGMFPGSGGKKDPVREERVGRAMDQYFEDLGKLEQEQKLVNELKEKHDKDGSLERSMQGNHPKYVAELKKREAAAQAQQTTKGTTEKSKRKRDGDNGGGPGPATTDRKQQRIK